MFHRVKIVLKAQLMFILLFEFTIQFNFTSFILNGTLGGLSKDYQYSCSYLDWLQDRKKLRKDWYNYLKAG